MRMSTKTVISDFESGLIPTIQHQFSNGQHEAVTSTFVRAYGKKYRSLDCKCCTAKTTTEVAQLGQYMVGWLVSLSNVEPLQF